MNFDGDITPEDYLSWHRNPLTLVFLRGLQEDRLRILEAWGRKVYTGESADQTLQLNAKGLAQIETIDQILDNLEETREEAAELIRNKKG